MTNANPYGAYQKQTPESEDIRISEARALLRVAQLMEEMQKPGTAYLDYSDAIRQNQQLWTLFQAGLAEEGNPLPPHLKDTLKGLSIYVDKRCIRAIANPEPQLLNVLININKNIANGLVEGVKNSRPATPAMPPVPPQMSPPTAGSSIGERV